MKAKPCPPWIAAAIGLFVLFAGCAPPEDASVTATPSAVDAAGGLAGVLPSGPGAELLIKGRDALDARRYQRAVQFLEQAAAQRPQDPEVFYLLGTAYWREVWPFSLSVEKAIQAFERVLQLPQTPNSPWAHRSIEQLARACLRNERLEEARHYLTQILTNETRADQVAKYQTQLQEIDLDQGTYVGSEDTERNEAGEILGPIGPLKMRTNQNFEKGRHTENFEKQVTYYQAAAQTDPSMYQSYYKVATALMGLTRYQEAIDYLAKAEEVSTGHQDRVKDEPAFLRKFQARLILCYIKTGDLESARKYADLAATEPGFDFLTDLHTAHLQVLEGSAEAALPQLEQMALLLPEHVRLLAVLAEGYAALNRFEEASRTMERVVRAAPPNNRFILPRLEGWKSQLQEWQSQARQSAAESP
jgi:tetratricopeptide (TPR) repeat protein